MSDGLAIRGGKGVRTQPFASRPVFGARACPHRGQLCGEPGAGLGPGGLRGTQDDLDDIAQAFEKVHARRGELGKGLA